MKTKLNGILTLFLALIVQVAIAQTVTGKVTDVTGEPVLGATVLVKGSSNATTTDFDGMYSINAASSDVLVVSFAGYTAQEVPVGSQSVINVTLKESLDSITIIGYKNTPPATSSVSAVTISSESIENRPNASFVQTLTGQVAGLNIFTNSGQPGANSTINIRGINSIGGNSEPLFVIDGAVVDEDNFRSLNPQDIASVSILKDAGATAIYGNRGANGVILITTRRGKFNQPLKVSVNSILSYTTLQDNDYNVMNSQELLTIERDRGVGVGARGFQRTPPFSPLTDAEIAAAPNTDWTDVFFRTGLTKNQTVSLSSGGDKVRQFTSLGYFDQEGILVQSDLKRFNLRNNISGNSENKKFRYNTNVNLNYSKSNEPNSIGSGAINRNYVLAAYQSVPYLTVDDYNNTPTEDLVSSVLFRDTPLFLLNRLDTYDRFEEEIKFVGSLDLSYDITDDITLRSVSGADYQNILLTRAEQSQSFNALLFGGGRTDAGFAQFSTARQLAFNQTTSLSWSKTFNSKHNVNVGLYTEYFKAHLRSFGFFEEGLDPRTFALGDGASFISDSAANDFYVDTVNATKRNAGLFSYFTSADYDYDGRFGFSGTFRRDASYRFSGSNRWANFWAVSGRWNLEKEEFLQDSEFIQGLKIRASYGTAGNQRIVDGGFFTAPDLYRDLFATGSGYTGANSLGLAQQGNSSLRWETVGQANIGVDFELLKGGRLRGALDVYQKKTEDLFQLGRTSGILGSYTFNTNVGNLYNRGIDFDVKYDVFQNQGNRDKVNLEVGLNFNYNRSELENLPNDDGEIPGIGRNGGQLGEYFVVEQVGVNPANGNLLFRAADGSLTENPSQDADAQWNGKNISPEFQGGFNLNADYKGFYVSALFNFATGIDRFDNDLSGFQDPTDIGQFNVSRDLFRAWTPTNRVTDIPSLDATNLTVASDRYMRESDYLRLRFINVGYNFDQKVLEKFNVERLRLFVNAENLVTFSKWRGFDAAVLSNTSRLYPTPRIISVGIELGI
ncbi:MAG: SusC/RagA family TonB-linked outer membrane protein [Nonlabens sp.]|uniref:SusC/RagA family TonB-linked outer membrane protein n=1 Tax=Nonlabens sp. TaxID=1888209 RepID=UPI003EFB2DFB